MHQRQWNLHLWPQPVYNDHGSLHQPLFLADCPYIDCCLILSKMATSLHWPISCGHCERFDCIIFYHSFHTHYEFFTNSIIVCNYRHLLLKAILDLHGPFCVCSVYCETDRMFNSNAGYRLPPFYTVTSNIFVEGLILNGANKHLQYHTVIKWLLQGLVTATKPCTINCWRLCDSAKIFQTKNLLCFQSIFKITVKLPLNGHPKWADLVVAYSR